MRFFFALILLTCMACAAPEDRVQVAPRSDAFWANYYHGLESLERHRLQQAERAFEACTRLDSAAYEGYWQLGRVRLVQGRLPEGMAALKRATELKPDLAAARQLILETYLGRNREALEEGRFDQAAAYAVQALEAAPQNYQACYQAAITAIWREEYDRADSLLRRAIDQVPDALEAKWHLRLVQERFGNERAALPEPYRFPDAVDLPGTPGGRFTEMAAQLGVAKFDGGRSSAWADYDGDGDLDLAVLGHPALAYYRNDGQRFTDQTQAAGLQLPEGGIGTQVADYDNDGDPDLYISRDGWFGGGANRLYRNNGQARFTEVAAQAGADDDGSGFCAAWGDYDRDGWVDLYVANGTGATGDSLNVLYRNNANGTFTDRASVAGVDHPGQSLSAAWGDFDGDAYPDLYLCNFTQPNVLYHNNADGTFKDITAQANVAAAHVDGFITFLLDYNNDGQLDIFVGNWSVAGVVLADRTTGQATQARDRPVLYRNVGDGRFEDVTEQAGLSRALGTMSGVPGDIDNDGFVDIYLGNGGPQMDRRDPDTLYRNRGDGRFEDITAQVGLGHSGKSHGVTFADFDRDGDLDLYVPVGGARPGDQWANALYRNSGFGHHWATFSLQGTRSNRDGLGARLRLRAGDLTQYAEVASGYSFGCSNSLEVHFGLAAHTRIDELEVRWPSGHTDVYRDLEVDRRYRILEGAAAPKGLP